MPTKCKMIMLLSNYSFFQYCNSNIWLFSIVPYKDIALNLLCFIFALVSLLLSFISFFDSCKTFYLLKAIEMSFTLLLLLLLRFKKSNNYCYHDNWKRTIPIGRAIQKRNHELIYIHDKKLGKKVKSDFFYYCDIKREMIKCAAFTVLQPL